MKEIEGWMGEQGLVRLARRSLALRPVLSTAIDTMLHGQDLLALVVGDVQRRDGSIRPVHATEEDWNKGRDAS